MFLILLGYVMIIVQTVINTKEVLVRDDIAFFVNSQSASAFMQELGYFMGFFAIGLLGVIMIVIGLKTYTIKEKEGKKEKNRKQVMLSLFTAIAYLSIYIVNFKVMFLTFDIKNVFITIAAMIFGPWAGILVSFVAALLELILYSTTGFYGFVMNFLSSASFAVIGAFLYRMKRTPAFSYIALSAATLGSTAIMMLANLLITPLYMGVATSEVAALIPKLLFPFNLIKCLVNAAVILILYKPISLIMRRAGYLKKESKGNEKSGEREKYMGPRTVVTLSVATLVIVVSLLIFFLVLNGQVNFGK